MRGRFHLSWSMLLAGLILAGHLTGPSSVCAQQETAEEEPAEEEAPLSDADEDARQMFEAGAVAYERGRYDLALSQFQESYRLSNRPVLLYNVGTTLDRLRRDEEAVDAFERFVSAMPDHPNAALARERITFLRARIAAEASGETSPALNSGDEGGDDIAGAWWLWTIVGAVVVGAAVGIGLGVGLSEQRALPLAGANAVVFEL